MVHRIDPQLIPIQVTCLPRCVRRRAHRPHTLEQERAAMEIAIDRRLGRDLFWFVLAESDFFEDPSTLPSNSSVYKDILDRLVPSEWRCGSGGIWLHALPPSLDLSPQGFKIHISGTSVNGEELLARVVPVCVDQEAGFKVIANPRILEQTLPRITPEALQASSSRFIPTTMRIS